MKGNLCVGIDNHAWPSGMMLRVAKIPSLNVAPAAIDAVAEELRGGDKTKESIDDGVLRIKGRHDRDYLFLLSDLFMDELPIEGDFKFI